MKLYVLYNFYLVPIYVLLRKSHSTNLLYTRSTSRVRQPQWNWEKPKCLVLTKKKNRLMFRTHILWSFFLVVHSFKYDNPKNLFCRPNLCSMPIFILLFRPHWNRGSVRSVRRRSRTISHWLLFYTHTQDHTSNVRAGWSHLEFDRSTLFFFHRSTRWSSHAAKVFDKSQYTHTKLHLCVRYLCHFCFKFKIFCS